MKYINKLKSGILSDPVIFWNFATCLLVIIIMVAIIYFKLGAGGESQALHYNVLVGIDLVGKGFYLYLVPVVSAIILIYNLILARRFYMAEKFASFLLMYAATLTSALLLVAIIALAGLS